jgi:hypothetical protein
MRCHNAIKRRLQHQWVLLRCLLLMRLVLLIKLQTCRLLRVLLWTVWNLVLLLFWLLVPCLLLLQSCRCICQLLLSPGQLSLQGRHLQHSNAHGAPHQKTVAQ